VLENLQNKLFLNFFKNGKKIPFKKIDGKHPKIHCVEDHSNSSHYKVGRTMTTPSFPRKIGRMF
jgi:hypothetical protein